jgi:uncharacterized repeat protein (TIGR01451 family)
MPGRLIFRGAALAALIAVTVAGTAVGGGADPADLSLTKTDDPDPVTEGGVLTYTLTIRNSGPDPATAVMVEDDLPKQVEFVGATASSGTCERQGGRVLCQLGDLAAGAEATVTIQVRPRKAGSLSNTATVESTIADPQAANNTDTEATQVAAPPAVATCAGRDATILGTPGNDVLFGDGARDVIRAFAGDDRVRARGGNDTVCLNAGNDIGRGGRGNDRLRGGAGSDVLRGGPGADTCRGGPGRDIKRSC